MRLSGRISANGDMHKAEVIALVAWNPADGSIDPNWPPSRFTPADRGVFQTGFDFAMVIPEELLTVGYADGLRRWLLQRFRRVIICLPDSNIFPDVQQAVVLVLCDQETGGQRGLLTLDYAALEEGEHEQVKPAPVWPWNSKWSHLYLPAPARRRLGDWWPELGWEPLSAYGRAEVGIVTGDNDFFIVTGEQAGKFHPRHLVPIITSAKDLRGIGFEAEDFAAVVSQNRRSYLLDIRAPAPGLPASERAYLARGEREHVSQRYKCRVRQPWYAVPGIRAADALLLRQSGDMPRLVHLGQRCAATDTIHRVNWCRPELGTRHAVGFLNTFTLLAAEVTGRSYGGGVLELMPSEANALPLPPPVPVLAAIFQDVDARVRAKDSTGALAVVDAEVLPAWMTKPDREHAREMLALLVKRRQSRSSGSSTLPQGRAKYSLASN